MNLSHYLILRTIEIRPSFQLFILDLLVCLIVHQRFFCLIFKDNYIKKKVSKLEGIL